MPVLLKLLKIRSVCQHRRISAGQSITICFCLLSAIIAKRFGGNPWSITFHISDITYRSFISVKALCLFFRSPGRITIARINNWTRNKHGQHHGKCIAILFWIWKFSFLVSFPLILTNYYLYVGFSRFQAIISNFLWF